MSVVFYNGIKLFWLLLFLTILIVYGHHEYHKEYYWPNTFSFVHKGLLSSNLWHFLCWVYIQLGTLPFQLIHRLYDSKLNCFSLLKLILVWMYYVHLTCCPHRNTRDWILEYPSLDLKPLRASMTCFIGTNSASKTDVSTINCFFENHWTNVVFTCIKKPLFDM